MAQVNVTINGRQYRMACEDGQEEPSDAARARASTSASTSCAATSARSAITRLTVMAALTVADELAEAGRKHAPSRRGDHRLAGRPRGRRRSRAADAGRDRRGAQCRGRADRRASPQQLNQTVGNGAAGCADSADSRTGWRSRAIAHYIGRAGLRGATESYSRGLTILKGAVPDRAPGSGHMAPTYLCRFPGSTLRRPSRLRTFPHSVSVIPGREHAREPGIRSDRSVSGFRVRALRAVPE